MASDPELDTREFEAPCEKGGECSFYVPGDDDEFDEEGNLEMYCRKCWRLRDWDKRERE